MFKILPNTKLKPNFLLRLKKFLQIWSLWSVEWLLTTRVINGFKFNGHLISISNIS